MNIADLLSIERVACDLPATSKKRLIENVANLIADSDLELSRNEVFSSLLARERLGSTGLGHGIALPHGRIKNGRRPIGAFVRLGRGIDYDAPDGKPVDLVFALVIPESANEEHLEILSKLAEMFSNTSFCERLRQCHSDAAAYESLTTWTPVANTA
jgi:PTS system nitrogen regulatory IIA component